MDVLAKDYIQKENTVKVVSASEAKTKLGSLIGLVARNKQDVVIENHGEPSVVMVPYTEYVNAQNLKAVVRRRSALERLEQLRVKVRSRNQDLSTETQALELTDRFVRDVVEDLIKEGKLRFS